jgi:hypothetical protein
MDILENKRLEVETDTVCLPGRAEEIFPSLIGGTSGIDSGGSRGASIGSTFKELNVLRG